MTNIVTVLTPVYNRKDKMKSLFLSLKKQTSDRFEWTIVDDGSTDGLKNVVEEFVKEAKFRINYLHKENGGKHTALNFGIKNTSTELTIIVDSDDYLTENAIEEIIAVHSKYHNNDVCGYSFLRQFSDGRINGNMFSEDGITDTYINMRINANDLYADKAEAYLTSCLKEFPFPEYDGEKFLGEDVVWIRMARKYKMVHINKPIYIGEYLENGLTYNRRNNNIKSPMGCMARASEFMKKDIQLKYRLKGTVQFIVYGKFANLGNITIYKKSGHNKWTIVCFIPAMIITALWKWRLKTNY